LPLRQQKLLFFYWDLTTDQVIGWPAGLSGRPQRPNAFKVEGAFLGSGLNTFFARAFLGAGKVTFTTSMVATVQPRQGCFLVDNSASMVRETHDWSFGAFLPDGAPGAPAGGGFSMPAYEYALYTWSINNPARIESNIWGSISTNNPIRGSNLTDPLVHYADDYRDLRFFQDEDYNNLFVPANINQHHPAPDDELNGVEVYHVTPPPHTHILIIFIIPLTSSGTIAMTAMESTAGLNL
jgi:hypothetical protein